ncbi:MAG: hypothetical protein R3E64_00265 [Halioglobus sp.]
MRSLRTLPENRARRGEPALHAGWLPLGIRFPVLLVLMVIVAACSNRQIYNALQQNQQLQCSKLPQGQFEACMREVDESYDAYQADREELMR